MAISEFQRKQRLAIQGGKHHDGRKEMVTGVCFFITISLIISTFGGGLMYGFQFFKKMLMFLFLDIAVIISMIVMNGASTYPFQFLFNVAKRVIELKILGSKSEYWGSNFPLFNSWQPDYVISEKMADLTGQVAIVTGATSGLGLRSAEILASRGAEVVICGITPEGGEAAMKRIRGIVPTAKLSYEMFNLCKMNEVSAFISKMQEKYDCIDMFVANAGFEKDAWMTEDGFNSVWQVNCFSQIFMVYELLPLLKKSELSRVAMLSSGAIVNFTEQKYRAELPMHVGPKKNDLPGFFDYAYAKLAMSTWSIIIAEQFEREGVNVLVNHIMPGFVRTPFLTDINQKMLDILEFCGFLYDPYVAALTQTHCVAGKEVIEKKITGHFFWPIAHTAPKGSYAEPTVLYDKECRKEVMRSVQQFMAEVKKVPNTNRAA